MNNKSLDLQFITSDCDCKFDNLPWDSKNRPWHFPKYETDEIKAYLQYKYEVERGTIWYAVHLNGAHINNIFVNNQSIRRIG